MDDVDDAMQQLPNEGGDEWLTVPQAAALAGVVEETIYAKWRRSKTKPPLTMEHRDGRWMVRRSELERFCGRGLPPQVPPAAVSPTSAPTAAGRDLRDHGQDQGDRIRQLELENAGLQQRVRQLEGDLAAWRAIAARPPTLPPT